MKNHSNFVAASVSEALILAVDDEPSVRQLIADSLRRYGLNCVTAASVGEGMAVLSKQKISLIILDWVLDRCGAELLRAARERDPQIPVLVISGEPNDPRTDALVERADAFLQKPFNLTVLVNQVTQILRRVQGTQDLLLPRQPEEILPLEEVKRQYVGRVVQLLNNNLSLAAAKLGVHRQTVASALKETALRQPTDELPGGHSGEARL